MNNVNTCYDLTTSTLSQKYDLIHMTTKDKITNVAWLHAAQK